MRPCDAKAMFFSKVEVLRASQSKGLRDVEFHVALDGLGAAPNAGPAVGVVLLSQNAHFCYCMRALLVNVFFAFAAKLHFVCIFTVCPVPPT